jgi:hypothetical protein
MKGPFMKILTILVGLVLLAMGGVWTLQGAGLVGGSFMTGQTRWLYIGIVVALAGLALLVVSRRFPPRP